MKLDHSAVSRAVALCALSFGLSTAWAEARREGALVRVAVREGVDESAEIRSRPYQVKHRSHVFRAMEAGAKYVETDSVLGDAFMIPLHDNGVKAIYRCTNIVDVQAAVDLGAKYIRTGDPESVRRELSRLEGTRKSTVKCNEFRIRDPYVFADPATKTYYMYETKSPYFGEPYARGVNVRTSRDLVTWSPLKEVMSVPTNLHCRTVWAPEVHEYKGAYYLFTTLSFYPTPDDGVPVLSDDPDWKPKDNIAMCRRGTWVYKADRPDGEFRPVTDGSVTPRNWMSLDGSLLVDEGKPYMVFCHEWTQIKYGRIDIARMSDDLSRLLEEPKVLFDSRVVGPAGGRVTDGCFCYRSPKTGRLFMIWSTFYNRGYTVFSCESKSGNAYGPWTDQKPIFEKNGGHGMIFRTFEGGLKLVLHQPERRGYERVAFFDVTDGKDGLAVVQTGADASNEVGGTAAFSPYGVVTDGSRSEYGMHDDLADLIKLGGMGYERVDWDWRACQKEKGGEFDFTKYDRLVAADEARGVTVLPIVYGPPSWGYPAWRHLDGFSAFVRATVRRYGTRLPVIEIWNEENIAGFWKEPNPTNYFTLLKAAYVAAKDENPKVRVALGGTAGWAHGFIRSLYELGAKDYFDIVNVHPYCYPHAPEEPLRRGFAELRKVMAEFGDGRKPIWFTEIGWPTHDVDLSGPGNVLVAGLKAARPDKKAWNVVYTVCKPDGQKPDQGIAESLLLRLPPGSKARVCGPKETCELLSRGGWDAVVYPPDETYPADTLDAVVEFVRRGGTLVDIGGMPMWKPYRNTPDGSGKVMPHDGGRERFARLKIGLDSWWLPGSELPKGDNPMTVHATPEGIAAGVRQSPTGFSCSHFFSDKALGPGDRMVPLIACTNPLNGKPAVAACTYLLNGDMKGRVVVCGIQKGHSTAFPVSERQQGAMFARAMGVSFAEGVEAFFWYSLRARERDRFYNEDNFGMVHANLVPKSAWLANKMFIVQRPAGSANLGGEWRKDGLFFPQWRRPDGSVGGMVWTDRPSGNLDCEFDSDAVSFHDMWGKPALSYGTGRTRRITVTGEPLYFTGARLMDCRQVQTLSESEE